jgi:hypothetical protein
MVDVNNTNNDDNDNDVGNNKRGIVVGVNPYFVVRTPYFAARTLKLSLDIRLQQSNFFNGSLKMKERSLRLETKRRMQQSDIMIGGFPKLRMIC